MKSALPATIDDVLYWLSDSIYTTRMQIAIIVIFAIGVTWIIARYTATRD